MKINDLNYNLPANLIAQYPDKKRDNCKLLAFDRDNNSVTHLRFNQIIDLIQPDDILIFNDTKVFSARLFGVKKGTGAKIEILLLEKKTPTIWKALIKPTRRMKHDPIIQLKDGIEVKPVERLGDGQFYLEFSQPMDYEDFKEIGEIPLPPYIKRGIDNEIDEKYYQTVYAENYGAIAAPTAGFHFTEGLIQEIQRKNIEIGYITLHISYATFAPVRTENIEDHKMYSEYVIIPGKTAELINNKKGKIIAVGTTVVRTLESAAIKKNLIKPFKGWVDTFIKPGYEFKIIDSLITNFHLPASTLLLLVSALIGLEKLKEIYQAAIDKKYKFFSYGDAMFIL